MQLVLTQYLEQSTDTIERRVGAAVPSALSAAAARIDAVATSPRGEARPHGVVLRGVDVLDGAEVDWDGDAGLTTLRVSVPWTAADGSSGRKLLAANRFAQVFSTETGA
jgi:hypothetical protein